MSITVFVSVVGRELGRELLPFVYNGFFEAMTKKRVTLMAAQLLPSRALSRPFVRIVLLINTPRRKGFRE